MEDKKFILALLAVLETMNESNQIPEEKGRGIAGDYWYRVLERLRQDWVAIPRTWGDLLTKDNKRIPGLIAYYRHELEEFERRERDKELDRESKRASIKAAKIAKWSIAISILAATGLPQYLLRWLYEKASYLICILTGTI